jgi:ABC-type sugar transport system ATPase subunit
VALAGGSPPLLLMDEPFSNLDPDLRAILRGELAALRRQLRVTAIYVTHDAQDAETLGDRTITIQPRDNRTRLQP